MDTGVNFAFRMQSPDNATFRYVVYVPKGIDLSINQNMIKI